NFQQTNAIFSYVLSEPTEIVRREYITEQSDGFTKYISRVTHKRLPNLQALDVLTRDFGGSAIAIEGIGELRAITDILQTAGYGVDRIQIDTSVVRGLEYYTGPVFEVDLTFATEGKDGSPRFGSVGGGGRYDGLISRFRSEGVPA